MRYIPSKRFDLFDDMFNGFFDEPRMLNNVMKCDIHEKEGYYTLDIELPGYTKEDVSMEIADGTLTIKAQHELTNEEKDAKGNLVRSERSFGSCSRSFFVGDNIKANDIKAKFENGMLYVTVPSAETKHIQSKETIMID